MNTSACSVAATSKPPMLVPLQDNDEEYVHKGQTKQVNNKWDAFVSVWAFALHKFLKV